MSTPRTLLGLPAEIRLQIWDLVLIPTPFIRDPRTYELILNPNYFSSAHINIICTCRQVYEEIGFTHALQTTVFLIRNFTLDHPLAQNQSVWMTSPLISNLRHLVLPAFWLELNVSDYFSSSLLPDYVRLHTLTIFFDENIETNPQNLPKIVVYLRDLENVKTLRFIRNGSRFPLRHWYRTLVGRVLKEDHYQRYDAENAPNIENTWWEWKFDQKDQLIEFAARPSKPTMEEKEYMEFVAPLIKALSDDWEAEENENMSRWRLLHLERA